MLPNTDRCDYYETMQGRLMKVIKPMSTPDGQNIYINYSKRALPYNIEMHPHVNVRVIPMTEFVHSDEKYAKFDQMAANGTIHPIDKIGHCYCRDYMIFNGQYDVSLRIPPMPARTYEIRFGYKNQGSSNGGESDNKNQGMSMVQVYIDGKVAYRAEDFGISNLKNSEKNEDTDLLTKKFLEAWAISEALLKLGGVGFSEIGKLGSYLTSKSYFLREFYFGDRLFNVSVAKDK